MKQYGQHPLGTQPVERCLRNMLISSSRDLMVHGIGEHNARGHSVAVDVDKAPLFVDALSGRQLRLWKRFSGALRQRVR
jgi:hypothetical protein